MGGKAGGLQARCWCEHGLAAAHSTPTIILCAHARTLLECVVAPSVPPPSVAPTPAHLRATLRNCPVPPCFLPPPAQAFARILPQALAPPLQIFARDTAQPLRSPARAQRHVLTPAPVQVANHLAGTKCEHRSSAASSACAAVEGDVGEPPSGTALCVDPVSISGAGPGPGAASTAA